MTSFDQRPEAWSDGASGYAEQFAGFTSLYAADALDLLGVGPGTHLLDVAAGTGAASLQAVERGATVLATDFAPGMVEHLRRALDTAGATGSRAEVMDGQALALDDGSVDVAISMFGLMFFPDIDRGLTELRRVVRPGGRIAVGVWDADGFTLSGCIGAAMAQVLPEPPPPRVPAWRSLATAEAMTSTLEAAGFAEVAVHAVTHRWRFADPERFLREGATWSPVMAGLLESLDDEALGHLARAFADLVADADQAGGLQVTANLGLGAVP